MGLIDNVFSIASGYDNFHRDANWIPTWKNIGNNHSVAGVDVTLSTALTLDSFYACARNIGEDIAKNPCNARKRIDDHDSVLATNHNAYWILKHEPNSEMSPFTFKEVIVRRALVNGGGIAEIQRGPDGKPKALWPIHPGRAELKRDDNGALYWKVKVDDIDGGFHYVAIPDRDMLFLHGPSDDGYWGYILTNLASETIGVGLATNRYQANFYKNDAIPAYMILWDQEMNDDAKNAFRKDWNEKYGGANQNSPIGQLSKAKDVKIEKLGSSPGDIDLESQKHATIESMARWFRMPPHKIQHLLRSTFSNIDAQNIEYVQDVGDPWSTRLEEEFNRKLFMENERKIYYTKFNLNKLLRGDPLKKANVNKTNFMSGSMSSNDIRRTNDQNGIGPAGDVYYVPMNMMDSANPQQPESKPATGLDGDKGPQDDGGNGKEQSEAFRPIFMDAINRVMTKHTKATGRAIKKFKDDTEAYESFLLDFEPQMAKYYAAVMSPIIKSMARFSECRFGDNIHDVLESAGGSFIWKYEANEYDLDYEFHVIKEMFHETNTNI